MSGKEKFKTYKNVFDHLTLRILFKLSSQGHFDELQSPISVGKESNVFLAIKGKDYVLVKIYRVNTCDFKRMYQYIVGDPRFEGLQKQRRKVIYAWAKREYKNLLLARKAGAAVPQVIAFLGNVLVMELIGNKGEPAPKLKDQLPKHLKNFSLELFRSLHKMYTYKLIHGDLSQYNILNYEEKPVLIDLSHGTLLRYPRAEELLERDMKTLINYFSRAGLKLDIKETLEKIKHGLYL